VPRAAHISWRADRYLDGMSSAAARDRTLSEAWQHLSSGRPDLALAAVERHLRLDPRDPQLLSMAARALNERGEHERAIETATRALARGEQAEPLWVRGDAQRALGRTDDAVRDLRRAMELAPEVEDVRVRLVATLEEAGMRTEARSELEPLLGRHPEGPDRPARIAYEHAKLLVHEHRHEAAIGALDAAIPSARPGSAPFAMMLHLRAKALDRLGRFDEAWESAMRAHRSRGITFDPDAMVASTDAIMARWNRASLAYAGTSGIDDPLPVFVCGMPRSGTSLVDQIIHAHPKAAGVGELDLVERWADSANDAALRGAALPGDARRVARRYIDHIRRLAPAAERISNKALGNVRALAHLARLFPGARIVSIEREPRDVAVSCVLGAFSATRYPWTSRPEWVSVAWRESQRLMEHWKRELDLPILDVRYEDLVTAGESGMRTIIEFLGLPWDPRVTEFHSIRRTVRTLSYDQVSRPLTDASIGRWRHYERHLGS
jgi:tetratricopeptide (TPR) repeat protein